MKKNSKKWKTIFIIVFLSVLCIGGAELAVCRVMDPALYARITAPVRQATHGVLEKGRQVIEAVGSELSKLPERFTPQESKAPDEELETQCAGAPSIVTDLTLADPTVTELVDRGDRQVLTGGTVELFYFNQGEEPWADQLYGRDPISQYGCGPTAMAMVVSSLSATAVNPAEMADWASANGHWASRSGSYLSLIEGAGQAYGLTVQPAGTPYTSEELRQDLSTGKLLVALVTKGHFTNRGHFIILRGVTLSGEILVADPNSTERSLAAWDPQIILDELSSSRSHGAPLWIISGPES